jgi:hypothetical protein
MGTLSHIAEYIEEKGFKYDQHNIPGTYNRNIGSLPARNVRCFNAKFILYFNGYKGIIQYISSMSNIFEDEHANFEKNNIPLLVLNSDDTKEKMKERIFKFIEDNSKNKL